jgi:hypothetical protein
MHGFALLPLQARGKERLAKRPRTTPTAGTFTHQEGLLMARALQIIRSGDDADAWGVIEGLMNRAYGRSKETVEHQTSELDCLLALPVEERERLRAELAERRARLEAV